MPSVSSSGDARSRLFLFLLTQQIEGGFVFFLYTSILHIRALGIDRDGRRSLGGGTAGVLMLH